MVHCVLSLVQPHHHPSPPPPAPFPSSKRQIATSTRTGTRKWAPRHRLQSLADGGGAHSLHGQLCPPRSGQEHDLVNARKLFDEMPDENSARWNSMVISHAKAGEHFRVLELFFRMRGDEVSTPDEFTFPSVLAACVALGDEHVFRSTHALLLKCGFSCHVVVGTVLVNGYVAFGSMDEARMAFDEIGAVANAVSWNAVVGGYVSSSRWDEAWDAFYDMQCDGVRPNHSTLAMAMRTSGAFRCLMRGKQLHAKSIICGYQHDTFVGNSLINVYAKCADVCSCGLLFDKMMDRSQVSWNSIISSYAHLGFHKEALNRFVEMQESGYVCDRYNLSSGLSACAGLADMNIGHAFHGYLVRRALDSDVVLGSALVDMYSKCGCMERACLAFCRLAGRNLVSWNALLSGYVEDGRADSAIDLYREMESANVKPDQYTFASLLTLCGDQGFEGYGREIHARVIKTIPRINVVLGTELVRMSARCGRFGDAENVFRRMGVRNSYAWNSLIEGCKENESMKAFELFRQMQLHGIRPDSFSLVSLLSVCTAEADLKNAKQIHSFVIKNMYEGHSLLRSMLVDSYVECGKMEYATKIYEKAMTKDVYLHNSLIGGFVKSADMEQARRTFDQMEERNMHTWNLMLMGCAKCASTDETCKMIGEMIEEGIEFNCSTLASVFSLCATLPALELGGQLHACVIKNRLANLSVVLDTAVVDMYARGGMIDEARQCFDKMKDRNVISWNALISGYARHGHCTEVFALFEQMKRERFCPNEITYLAMLSACSHTGLVEEGTSLFLAMQSEHGIEPRAEHYTCMVDLLGRAGLLDDARELIVTMPVEPEVSTWGALLAACRIHSDADIGKVAADQVFQLDPDNLGYYILMANIYAATGRFDEAKKVRKLMKARAMDKEPGVSWIEIGNQTLTFQAGSETNP